MMEKTRYQIMRGLLAVKARPEKVVDPVSLLLAILIDEVQTLSERLDALESP